MLATDVVLLLQAPPDGVQVSVLVIAIQPLSVPPMADGEALMVMVLVLLQAPDTV